MGVFPGRIDFEKPAATGYFRSKRRVGPWVLATGGQSPAECALLRGIAGLAGRDPAEIAARQPKPSRAVEIPPGVPGAGLLQA